ncbi:dehydrogenase [Streptomyces sp. SID4919]|uniref:Dehydrogenase n=1 Tax=Streptomyces uncialis TaxID=1048205 RepID=A0A1Q4V0I2_9ACTN|nr:MULTISPECIES: FAD binding domain-containing protein [Streptomyces]MCX4664144.1 FAD binding domain-containing protein [Streptomyces uncialis]MYY10834.1 dehydrogenase [Streptomyces sp. SID4919]OKH91249.1 dehydrogenase [Streptomyces uncialis]WST70196.1 FAD binding domain-containing protein [Streptomyces uncialis]WTE11166.1 FAD binding domain-containing protein [Streptomyces uncialis]
MTTHAPQAARSVTLPGSLDEAVAVLAATPAAVPVAGGTDLMTSVNSGQLRPAALVGLSRISEIRGWQYQDGHALLGAGLTHARMGRPDFAALIPALAAAARAAGPPQIRNAGTLGGNIATGAPTGDALPVLAALEATVVLAGPGGSRREIPVSHLLAGMEMLAAGELIGYVRVPILHAPQVFLKATGRTGPGRATASIALVLDPARRGVRCAVGAVAPMPLRPLDAEQWIGRLIDWDGSRTVVPEALTAFGEYVAAACIPDAAPTEGGAPQPLPPAVLHLRRTVAVLARRALGRALS